MARAASWEQPAADLARQVAAIAGPGPAHLTIRNNSTLSLAEIPPIRRLLERDLRSFGVLTGPADSATQIRITLSQNQQGGVWVAEIVEGTESRVTMLPVVLGAAAIPTAGANLTLHPTLIFSQNAPILDAATISFSGGPLLIVLEPERIVTYGRNANTLASIGTNPAQDWHEIQAFPIVHTRPFPRDLRGRIVSAQDHPFDAWLPGVLCTASAAGLPMSVSCADSDDPWPVSSTQRAFYNGTRDNFTGVLAPGYGMDLPPFYQAAEIPRPTGPALLLSSVDGRVLLIDYNIIKPVAGTTDWGSDLALIRSSCGSGAQLLVSASGSASAGDSLRAWEIPGREAIPVSAAQAVDGAIVSLNADPSPATSSTEATMIVRRNLPGAVPNSQFAWQVWNVAAVCN